MSGIFLVRLGGALLLVLLMSLIWFVLWLFHHANKGTDKEDLGQMSPGWLRREGKR